MSGASILRRPRIRPVQSDADVVEEGGGESGLLARMDEELRIGGYAASTRETYVGSVRRFLEATGHPDGLPGEAEVRSYLMHLVEERGLSPSHVNQCADALSFFYRQICGEALDPATLPRQKRRPTLPEVLSRREVVALLNRVDSPRYRPMLMLTYAAGLRATELVRLRPEDLDSERSQLHVRSRKGRDHRTVMLSDVALREVRTYRQLESSPIWLFPGARPGQHLSAKAVRTAFGRARDAAGIGKEVGMRSLRHSFAVHLLEAGTDLRHVQKLLGHTRRKSTRIYARLATPSLTAIPSPLDAIADQLSG